MKFFDVWAEWCPPCKKFGPIFEKVAQEFPQYEFKKIDADNLDNQDFLYKHSIRSIPTILVIDDSGEVLFQHAGILNEPNFRMLVRNLATNK